MKINELQWLTDELREKKLAMPKTLVYSPFHTSVTEVFNFLMTQLKLDAYINKQKLFSKRMVGVYYAGIGDNTKEYIQKQFVKGDSSIRVLVCTVAYGMGVNIPDIHNVIHWGCSTNALSYWQEVGRAGRDGSKVNALMYVVPDLFHAKVQDADFVKKVKDFGGLESKDRASKGKNKAVQTEAACSCFEDSTPNDDSEETVETKCFRRFILEQLVLAGMKGLDVLGSKDCTGTMSDCPLHWCCSFCRERCECMIWSKCRVEWMSPMLWY